MQPSLQGSRLTQKQQAEMQRMLSWQLSVVAKQLEELKKARLPEVWTKSGSQGLTGQSTSTSWVMDSAKTDEFDQYN